MMRPKATAAPLTSSTHQIVPVQKEEEENKRKENEKKKKEREIQRQRGDGFTRPPCSGTCSQSSEL
jgi:hypothetical protein